MKSENMRHSLLPFHVPAWIVRGSHHALCPVKALLQYLESTRGASSEFLFVNSANYTKPLSATSIASILIKVIQEADPDTSPKAHEARAFASTLAFLRSHSLEQVREGGQWKSYSGFS